MAKRLYRSQTDSLLGGVCSGIAKYLDADPSIIRLLWILLVFVAGGGLLAYIIVWIIIPREPYRGYLDSMDYREGRN